MIDLHLRADSEAALKAAIPFAVSGEGEWIVASHQWGFDPIGAVVVTPAVLGLEGEVVEPAVLDARFHANLRLLDESLANHVPAEVRISVTSPCRVWA